MIGWTIGAELSDLLEALPRTTFRAFFERGAQVVVVLDDGLEVVACAALGGVLIHVVEGHPGKNGRSSALATLMVWLDERKVRAARPRGSRSRAA